MPYSNYNEKESEKDYVCVCIYIYMPESLCCRPEANTSGQFMLRYGKNQNNIVR